jgi:hypothetical protein
LDGEKVIFALLDDNLAIRVWDGDLAPCHAYSFDFVNHQRQYIPAPPGLKIYAEANGFIPGGEVLSIEASLERAMVQSMQFRRTIELARGGQTGDPNWETYIIPEGTRLRITQLGKADCFLNIPIRTSNGRTLTLQPWWSVQPVLLSINLMVDPYRFYRRK